jgi:ABC-type antimicrobial peptide transport system permease subunit
VEQDYMPALTLYVRAKDAVGALENLRPRIEALDRNLPRGPVETVDVAMHRRLWGRRISTGLLAVFGVLGLALAGVGIYGVTAYSVAQRTSEIGIRMALGADAEGVLRLVMKEGLMLAGPGVLIGSLVSLALSRATASLLFGISGYNPGAYAATCLLLMAATMAASYVPARRATRVDPLIALRQE